MDFREIIKYAMREYMDDLRSTLSGLSEKERRYQPDKESHHIDFVVWHMARVEDAHLHRMIQNKEQIWIRDGWDKHLGMRGGGTGSGYTADDVLTLPKFDIGQMLEYYDAVRIAVFDYIDSLNSSDLDVELDEKRKSTFNTSGKTLSHLIVEEAEHTGQIRYLRGIQRGINK
jgi:uncharacterized damage-inducible protein DinB